MIPCRLRFTISADGVVLIAGGVSAGFGAAADGNRCILGSDVKQSVCRTVFGIIQKRACRLGKVQCKAAVFFCALKVSV